MISQEDKFFLIYLNLTNIKYILVYSSLYLFF